MKFPKLKNALLCRILVYVVVIGGFIAPIIIVANLKFVPEAVKVIVGIGLAVGLLIYLLKIINHIGRLQKPNLPHLHYSIKTIICQGKSEENI